MVKSKKYHLTKELLTDLHMKPQYVTEQLLLILHTLTNSFIYEVNS